MSNQSEVVQIGWGKSAATTTYSNGYIANICIYDRAVTAPEVQSMYYESGTFCLTAPGVIEYWPMDGTTGTIIPTLFGKRGQYQAIIGGDPTFIGAPVRTIKTRY
jgi:hypothetical protein